MIKDKFNRTHDYLRISLTERCNLRCFYCMPEEGVQLKAKSHFMSAEEVVDIAKTFVKMGVKKIRLTGGEPLVNKDAKTIIKELGKLPVELSITTNAILVDRFIETFKDAGIKSINVSLDSLDETRFNDISRRNYFNQIRENIDLLIEHKFNVKINVVLIKNINDHEILDFVNWTKEEKVDIRFIEFMPFDGNNWNWDKKVSYQEILNQLTEKIGSNGFKKIQDQKNFTSRDFQLVDGIGTFGIISSVTNPFCDSCNRIRLTADGKIKNCLFSNSETNILEAYRSGLPIEKLIESAINSKHKERAGLVDFKDDNIALHENRSMTTIGG